MTKLDVLIKEYEKLWDEKIIHKVNIRKFHNYITYITAISSLALTFYGIHSSDLLRDLVSNGKNGDTFAHFVDFLHLPIGSNDGDALTHIADVIQIFCIIFPPLLLIIGTFPLNDIFHIYVIGNHIASIEERINIELTRKRSTSAQVPQVLSWESYICPRVYGGKKLDDQSIITNVIRKGDSMLLFPALGILWILATLIACTYLFNFRGLWIGFATLFRYAPGIYMGIYIAILTYMTITVLNIGLTIGRYTKANGPLNKLHLGIIARHDSSLGHSRDLNAPRSRPGRKREVGSPATSISS